MGTSRFNVPWMFWNKQHLKKCKTNVQLNISENVHQQCINNIIKWFKKNENIIKDQITFKEFF